jgi:glycosyltransferase involved in cell wall biosynthesis
MAKLLIVASLASSLVRFRGDLIRAILAAGHRIHAAAPGPDDNTIQTLDAWSVGITDTPLSRASLNPLSDIQYLRALKQAIHIQRPDAVLAYTPKPVIYSGIACRMEDIPHFGLISGLGYGFGTESVMQKGLAKILTALYRHALKKSRRVIFQNCDDLEHFVQLGIVNRTSTFLVSGSGVDSTRFAVQDLPEAPVFLLMARLIPEKGVREYAAAARSVKLRVPQAKFLLAGWTEDRHGAISTKELGAWQKEGTIEYLGALDDVRPAIRRASVYVLPSYYREGVPRSILEAMAMGRAIITTDSPGCRETVKDGQNGMLVAPRDAEALARAMYLLATDRERATSMGHESRRLIEDRFTVERVNGEMMNALELAQ